MSDETWLDTLCAREATTARERLFTEMCQAWLRFLLTPRGRFVADLMSEVEEHLGLSAEVVERAGEALGVVECVVAGQRWWHLPLLS